MRVAVLTSSRADFGIYLPLLRALQNDDFFELDIVAFGTHLSPFHGHTINQIEEQGFIVRYRIESMLVSDSKESIATAMSLTMLKFSSFWQQHQSDFDLVFCLGDRYEMFSAVMAGVPFQIKFAHIHGGEKTLGAIDNVFRHAISHAASLHFTSTEQYKERIKEMIDKPRHVYNVGALSLENLSSISFLSVNEFQSKWGINLLNPTILTTFHPETIDSHLNEYYVEELVSAIKATKGYQFLITMPNSDTEGNKVRKILEVKLSNEKNVFLIENLGTQSYFSAMKYCKFLLGNTSSGIIEAATFEKYAINLGIRQQGRACSNNVVDISIKTELIIESIAKISKQGAYVGPNIYHKADGVSLIVKTLRALDEQTLV